MKDKTHSMNMGYSGDGAVNGFEKCGKPESTDATHQRRMKQGGLAGNEALEFYENPSDGQVPPAGGFLRRNNYGQRS